MTTENGENFDKIFSDAINLVFEWLESNPYHFKSSLPEGFIEDVALEFIDKKLSDKLKSTPDRSINKIAEDIIKSSKSYSSYRTFEKTKVTTESDFDFKFKIKDFLDTSVNELSYNTWFIFNYLLLFPE